jgi:hypothetical protein
MGLTVTHEMIIGLINCDLGAVVILPTEDCEWALARTQELIF